MPTSSIMARLSVVAVSALLFALQTVAQSIVPFSWQGEPGADNLTQLAISRGDHMVALRPVIPLGPSSDEPPPVGLSGQIYPVNETSYLTFPTSQVAYISCDNYTTNIDLAFLLNSVVQANASAVLLYTLTRDYCGYTNGTSSFKYLYTTRTRADATDLDTTIASSGSKPLYVTLGGPDVADSQQNNGTNGTNSSGAGSGNGQGGSGQQQSGYAPSPTTAVAMIILYSITGVITGLFLIIIITGAVRAHRNPERYGPRAILGRPRQSRARGLGRAILDTIPIVKFGERDDVKTGDVELAGASAAEAARDTAPGAATDGARDTNAQTVAQSDSAQPDEGISAAARTTEAAPQQGCSICTDDFELGQDQRVLPCDHRFHPECIDPWLLNVSSTCPLCRIDLRPAAELDENGDPRADANDSEDVEGLAPPLTEAGTAQPNSVRRSLVMGVMGVRRPETMTRDQRIIALREYRDQQAGRRGRRERALFAQAEGIHGTSGARASTDVSGERTRDRLRRVLGVRTRRTGEEETAADSGGEPQTEASNTAPRAA